MNYELKILDFNYLLSSYSPIKCNHFYYLVSILIQLLLLLNFFLIFNYLIHYHIVKIIDD